MDNYGRKTQVLLVYIICNRIFFLLFYHIYMKIFWKQKQPHMGFTVVTGLYFLLSLFCFSSRGSG